MSLSSCMYMYWGFCFLFFSNTSSSTCTWTCTRTCHCACRNSQALWTGWTRRRYAIVWLTPPPSLGRNSSKTVPVTHLLLGASGAGHTSSSSRRLSCQIHVSHIAPLPMLLLPDMLKFKQHDLVKANHVDGSTSYPPSQRGEYCLLWSSETDI